MEGFNLNSENFQNKSQSQSQINNELLLTKNEVIYERTKYLSR